jgi:glutaredoxin-like protein NrdH
MGTPSCQQCKATTRTLDDKGIEYEYIDMSIDEKALEHAKSLGYISAPVVLAGSEHWSGFRPDKLSLLTA